MQLKTSELEKQLIAITQQLLLESSDTHAHKTVTMESSLQRHLGIDSLGRAELCSRIEKHFGVQLPQQLLAEANTLKDILDTVITLPKQTNHTPTQTITPEAKTIHIDPASAQTLIDVLLLYAIQTPERAHIYLQDEYGKEEIITYGKLLDTSLHVANTLQQKGLRPGDTVAIMLPTTAGFFYAFFGVLLAGCIPVPIYPPFRPHQIESYAKQEAKILRNAEVRILITFHQAENLSKLLRAFIPSLKEVCTVDSLLKSSEKAPIYPRNSDDFALIQYTSGSTSVPKGVLLTHANLLANIRCFGNAIQVSSHDVAVSWAPLYHDLGLIGMWLGSLYHGVPLTIMSPLTFLTHPERWLWAIHYHRGTISGGPNFAYELCVRKIDPAHIEGLDLSSWRLAVNGAEAIQPKTLENFTKKFAPYGFRSEAHFPVYGLAESTVCVATSPLNRGPRVDIIQRESLEKEGKAIPTTTSDNTLEFIACGKAIPEHAMRIVDANGTPLAERHVGQLQFKGPSSMQGYYGNPEATQAVFHDGWWGTGDLAYIADEEVFITGRKKDLIIKAGRNLYPAEIEELTGQVKEVRKGCVIAFGVADPARGTEKLIIVAETKEKNAKARDKIIEAINEKIVSALDMTPDDIVLVPLRTIPKTSSGKLQRSACKNDYLNKKLARQSLPAWLQITKLGMRFTAIKFANIVKTFLKLIYTTYSAILLSISIPFLWLSLFILSRKNAAGLFRFWARALSYLVFCPINIADKKNLYQAKPVIFTPNHTTYLDAILLLAIVPTDTCLAGKKELLDIPIISTFMRKLNYIALDRLDPTKGTEETNEISQQLKQGRSVMLFPEGTFSYATGLRPFKLGAFKVAAETGTPICPIALQGARYILRGEEKLMSPHKVNVHVGKLIYPHGTEWKDITKLKEEVREQIAKNCGETSLDYMMTGIAAPREK